MTFAMILPGSQRQRGMAHVGTHTWHPVAVLNGLLVFFCLFASLAVERLLHFGPNVVEDGIIVLEVLDQFGPRHGGFKPYAKFSKALVQRDSVGGSSLCLWMVMKNLLQQSCQAATLL